MSAGNHRFKELELAIDRVVDSYDSGLEIDNLQSAALPNKRAVIEALRHLEAVADLTVQLHRDPGAGGLDHHLVGVDLPVEEVASHVGTIGYELVTRVAPRVERVYVEGARTEE